MKLHKFAIALAAITLAVSSMAFAADKVAVSPDKVTLNLGQQPGKVQLNGLCSQTCSLSWTIIKSDDNVGDISPKNGPVTNFYMGSKPGTAWVFVSDGQGHLALATIIVQGQ
jgi:hypothetical protein